MMAERGVIVDHVGALRPNRRKFRRQGQNQKFAGINPFSASAQRTLPATAAPV